MEEEKKLYPLRFVSIKDEYIWGSDTFMLADLGYRDSYVLEGWLASNTLSDLMETYMDRVTGDNVFSNLGRQFPVQVKFIQVRGRMPLRVHPDAETAADRYDQLGREKLWYVLRAGKDASLIVGFREDTDAGVVYDRCLDGSVESILNSVTPVAGQAFHIRPGIPHAASGDVDILEISESSCMDFCMCGWNEIVSEEEFDPSFSLVDALDFIDYKAFVPQAIEAVKSGSVEKLLSVPEFSVNRFALDTPLHSRNDQFDSYILYSCISGSAAVIVEVNGLKMPFDMKAGDTMLIPAECQDFYLVPKSEGTVVLEVTTPEYEKPDRYINPDSAPTLPDE